MKRPTFVLHLAVCLFFASIFASCNTNTEPAAEEPAAPTFDLATAKAEIIAANKAWSENIAKKDSAGVANLYTTDGKLMMEGAPAFVGRPAIQHVLAGFINSGITSIPLTTVDVWGTENLVAEEGQYTLFAGDAQVGKGKYIVLWKKEDGNWHLFRDIFNSDQAE